jgi:hypothetical protein
MSAMSRVGDQPRDAAGGAQRDGELLPQEQILRLERVTVPECRERDADEEGQPSQHGVMIADHRHRYADGVVAPCSFPAIGHTERDSGAPHVAPAAAAKVSSRRTVSPWWATAATPIAVAALLACGAEQSAAPLPAPAPRGAASPSAAAAAVATPVAGAASMAQFPAQVLDLANWKLTLPVNAGGATTGAPIEIQQPALAAYAQEPYFRVRGDGVQFRAPVNGVTTAGSRYPRSELREMTNNGTRQASWSTTEGVHTMVIDQAITAVPATKPHAVAGQIHDAKDDVLTIRLERPRLFVDHNGTDGATLVAVRSNLPG